MPLGTLVEVTNPATEEENVDSVLFINLPDVLHFYMAQYLTPHDFDNLMFICKSVHHALRGGPGQFYLPAVVIRKEGCKPFMPMIEQSYHGTLDDKGRLSNQSYRLVLTVQGKSTEARTYQQLLELFNSGHALALLTGQGESCLKKPQNKKEQRLNKAFKEAFASALSFRNINLKEIPSGYKKYHSLYYLHTLNTLVKLLQCDGETEETNAKKIKALRYLRDNLKATSELYKDPSSRKVLRACEDTLHTKASATRRRGEYWAAFMMALGLFFAVCGLIVFVMALAFNSSAGIGLLCLLSFVVGYFIGCFIIHLAWESLCETVASFKQGQYPDHEDAILPALHDWQESQYEVIYGEPWRSEKPNEHNLSFFSLKPEEPIEARRLGLGPTMVE